MRLFLWFFETKIVGLKFANVWFSSRNVLRNKWCLALEILCRKPDYCMRKEVRERERGSMTCLQNSRRDCTVREEKSTKRETQTRVGKYFRQSGPRVVDCTKAPASSQARWWRSNCFCLPLPGWLASHLGTKGAKPGKFGLAPASTKALELENCSTNVLLQF